jgi:xanthine dehydrogenase molybdenum-binding subunit
MNVAEKKVRLIPPGTLIGKRIPQNGRAGKAGERDALHPHIDLPGQLYGKILRSARVHARIRASTPRRPGRCPACTW